MKWYQNLTIQKKLFFAFAVTILMGVTTVLINLFIMISVRGMDAQLAGIYIKANKSYQAQVLLQNLELAEKTYTLTEDPRWLNEFDNYDARLDEYLQEALLEATSAGERAKLHELEQIKVNHTGLFEEIKIAVREENWAVTDELIISSEDDIFEMYDRIDWIGNQEADIVTDARTRQSLFLAVSTIVTTIAGILFFVMAILAAAVITKQLNQPVDQLTEAVTAIEDRTFEPGSVVEISARDDEMGRLAQAFIRMQKAVENRETELKHQAEEIRAKLG